MPHRVRDASTLCNRRLLGSLRSLRIAFAIFSFDLVRDMKMIAFAIFSFDLVRDMKMTH